MLLPHIKLFKIKNKQRSGTSFPASFSAWLLKRYILLLYFPHDFCRDIFLLLYSVNWPKFIVWLSLPREILSNKCIVIVCYFKGSFLKGFPSRKLKHFLEGGSPTLICDIKFVVSIYLRAKVSFSSSWYVGMKMLFFNVIFHKITRKNIYFVWNFLKAWGCKRINGFSRIMEYY